MRAVLVLSDAVSVQHKMEEQKDSKDKEGGAKKKNCICDLLSFRKSVP